MITPRLFVGGGGTPRLARVGEGVTDAGVAYALLAETNKVAPAGPSGEAIFTAYRLALIRYDTAVTLHVVVTVDAQVIGQYPIVLAAGPSGGTLETHEIILSVPYIRDGVERFRTPPRGRWVNVKVYTDPTGDGLPPGAIALLGGELEYEVVRETLQMEATP